MVEIEEIKRLEFVNDLALKNLKHYQNKINEIIDMINKIQARLIWCAENINDLKSSKPQASPSARSDNNDFKAHKSLPKDCYGCKEYGYCKHNPVKHNYEGCYHWVKPTHSNPSQNHEHYNQSEENKMPTFEFEIQTLIKVKKIDDNIIEARIGVTHDLENGFYDRELKDTANISDGRKI